MRNGVAKKTNRLIELLIVCLGSALFASHVNAKVAPAHLSVQGKTIVQHIELTPSSRSKNTLPLDFIRPSLSVTLRKAQHLSEHHSFFRSVSSTEQFGAMTVLMTRGDSTAIGEIYSQAGQYYFEIHDHDMWVVDISKSRLLPALYENDTLNIASAPQRQTNASATPTAEDPAIVDTLLLYTPNIVAAYPGEMTQTLLNHLIAKANQTFVNSDVHMQLRLVGTQFVDFTQPSSLDALNLMATALDNDNTTTTDPSLLGIANERERVGADLVAMIRTHDLNEREVCGVARFPNANTDVLINVSNVGISGGSNCLNTFTHEVGHNFGAGHQQVNGNSVGALPYSGALIALHQYNTVMSSIGTGDENRNYKLSLFSNIHNDCGGDLCGDAAVANNARTMNEFALQNAALRAQVVPGTIAPPSKTTPDTDADGVDDTDDHFPFFVNETSDDDNDGVGNNTDAFPSDPAESLDTDGDGIGNNSDTDDDGDGVVDAQDALPLDPRDSIDNDGDTFGASRDTLDNDFQEQFDADGDGIGDIADRDDDNDGVPDFFAAPTLAQSELLVVSADSHAILSFAPETGAFLETVYQVEDGGFSFRSDLIVAPDQQLFFVAFSDVMQFDRQRQVASIAIPRRNLATNFAAHLARLGSRLYVNSGLGISHVQGFALTSQGNQFSSSIDSSEVYRDIEVIDTSFAYVVSRSANQVLTVNPSDPFEAPTIFASTGLDKPEHMAFNERGQLLVTNAGNGTVSRFTPQGQFIDTFISAGSGGLGQPGCIAIGPDQHVYVCSTDTDEILRYDGDTGAFLDIVVAANIGGLNKPVSIAFASRFADEFIYDPNHDSDNDGVLNPDDAFPLDPTESIDTDGDGVGNNSDEDDDGDGMPDSFETEFGFDPLDPADASLDADNDGFTNLQEFTNGTDPTVANSPTTPTPPAPNNDSGGSMYWLWALLSAVLLVRKLDVRKSSQ